MSHAKTSAIPPQSIPGTSPFGRESLRPLNPTPIYVQAEKQARPGSALALLVGGGL